MGNKRALYGTPKEFKYYEEKQGWFAVGRGLECAIRDYVIKKGLAFEPEYRTVRPAITEKFLGHVTLRDYQEDAYLDASLKYLGGVIRLGTGFGKSVLAAKLAKDLGLKTLILVHRGHLLAQFQAEFKKWYGYDPGVIQGDRVEPKDITLAMVQTLVAKPQVVEKIKTTFGTVIVDECHTYITGKRLAVVQAFNPHHLYGLTATAFREDGQSKAIHFTFGETLCDADLPRSTPSVELRPINTGIRLDEYNEMVSEMVQSAERTRFLVQLVHNQIKAKRTTLILTKRIEHYQKIKEGIGDSKGVYTIDSSDKQEDRAALLAEFREGTRKFSVLLGTFSMLSTGTDIPCLDTMIFAGDLRSKLLTHQATGRILRLFEGKKEPLIIDVIDSDNKVFARQALERQAFYKKSNWKII